MADYLFLIVAWVIYLFLHSLLAGDRMKKRVTISPKNYRLFYSTLSTLGLLGLMFLIAVIPPEYLYSPTQMTRYIGMVFAVWGVIVVNAAFRYISLKAFLGLKNEANTELITTGLHGKVRHPIYSGTILIMVGMLISVPNYSVLNSCVCIFLYLPIGIHLEEKKLTARFGEAYLVYRKQVKAIIPGLI